MRSSLERVQCARRLVLPPPLKVRFHRHRLGLQFKSKHAHPYKVKLSPKHPNFGYSVLYFSWGQPWVISNNDVMLLDCELWAPSDRDHLNKILQICGTPDSELMDKIESASVSHADFPLPTCEFIPPLLPPPV